MSALLPASVVPSLIAGPDAPRGDPEQRPSIGALRRQVPRWGHDEMDVAGLDRTPQQGDACGGIDPSALYQALKRLFARVAEQALLAELLLDGMVLRSASTHWLRHFFANKAIDGGVTYRRAARRDGALGLEDNLGLHLCRAAGAGGRDGEDALAGGDAWRTRRAEGKGGE